MRLSSAKAQSIVQGANSSAWPALLSLAVGICLLADPCVAHAHGFGERYALPVPLWLYLIGAAAAVALSFLFVALFVRVKPRARPYAYADLLRFAVVRLATDRSVGFVLRLASVGLLGLVVATGLWGIQSPLQNLAPTFVWVIWWVGMAYLSVFVGNFWSTINPWGAVFGWAEALYARLRPGRALSISLAYPESLGVWPGALLLLAFVWIELIFPDRAVPAALAWLILGYSAVTWFGMLLFGREIWLKYGEAFSIAFGMLARFSPTEIRVLRTDLCPTCQLKCVACGDACVGCPACFARAEEADRVLAIRPCALGLLRDEPVSPSQVAFVLLMLSTVLFDGLLVTTFWARIEGLLQLFLPGSSGAARMTLDTLGIVLFWLLFLGAYLGVCWVMQAMIGSRRPLWTFAGTFAYTLVPIAIAYHLAHYLTFLIIQGQYIIPLASDPFGYGWNLLGSAGYRADVRLVGPKFAWYVAAMAIVTGHAIAVYLAHVKAIAVIGGPRRALRSQYAMTALMIAYTVTSLSILAQPIVEREAGASAEVGEEPAELVAVPPDAVIPEAGSGVLRRIGPGRLAQVRLTYRLLASKFHDGTETTFADLLYPYMFAYRWGAQSHDGGAARDPYVEWVTTALRQHLVAFRIPEEGKTSQSIRFGDISFTHELLSVEVYASDVPSDPEAAAAFAPPWSTLPWHVMALMEQAVEQGWAAFSDGEASRHHVVWLDLVRDHWTKQRLASLVERFAREGYVPDSLKGLVSTEEARARWRALESFYEKYGHFLVTNGPYVLDGWSDKGAVLGVFRDLSYPLGVGSFDRLAIPHKAYIAGVEQRGGKLKIFADVEKVQKFQRSYAIVREPLSKAVADVFPQAPPECRYVVVGADGNAVVAGSGRLEQDGTFTVDLGGKLRPGSYTVMIALYLNGNAVDPEIRRIPYEVGPVTDTR